jgi:hypothetical protein
VPGGHAAQATMHPVQSGAVVHLVMVNVSPAVSKRIVPAHGAEDHVDNTRLKNVLFVANDAMGVNDRAYTLRAYL